MSTEPEWVKTTEEVAVPFGLPSQHIPTEEEVAEFKGTTLSFYSVLED
jgi:hypothetical protein